MIDSYLLNALAVFSEQGTLVKTSQVLNISQPALTRSMQKLEQELGVSIFTRAKNRICLNETGKTAARYAKKILKLQTEMVEKLSEQDRIVNEITFASIAPAPIFELNPLLKEIYPGIKINSEIKNTEEELFKGLEDGTYNFVICRRIPSGDSYFSKEYFKENLNVFVPENHRLAKRKSIYLKDLAGETFIMLSELGFWAEIKKKKIPDAKFITQEESEKLKDLVESSSLPTFITDIAQKSRNFVTYSQKGRVAVPILDPEVNVTFYIVLKKQNMNRFSRIFDEIE